MSRNIDSPKTLSGICSDFFFLVIQIRVVRQFETYRTLLAKAKSLLDSIDSSARKAGISSIDIEDSKFALCGLLDQVVKKSADCPFLNEWRGHSLEQDLFDTSTAGTLFYEKLEKEIRPNIETRVEAARVYYHCLTLGFQNRYIKKDDENNLLIDSLGSDLRKFSKKEEDKLSLHWELPLDSKRKKKTNIPLWAVFGGALLIVVLTVFLLRSASNKNYQSLVSELSIASKMK